MAGEKHTGKILTGHTTLGVLVMLLVGLGIVLPAECQASAGTSPGQVTRQIVEAEKDRVASNEELASEVKPEILRQYDLALEALEEARNFTSQIGRFQADRESVSNLTQALQVELQRPMQSQQLGIQESTTAADVEQMVRQAGAGLDARREALRNLQQTSRRRTERLVEIGRRTATLNQLLFELDAQAEAIAETVHSAELDTAMRARLSARQHATQQEIAALEAERRNYSIRSVLLPLREQRAERRVAEAVQRVAALEQELSRRVRAETEQNLRRLLADAETATNQYPEFQPLADEIMHYAVALYGPDGVSAKAEPLAPRANRVREALGTAKQVMDVSRAKYEALGSRADLLQWFPVMPANVPRRQSLVLEIEARKSRIADAQAELVTLRDKRNHEQDLDAELAAFLRLPSSSPDGANTSDREALCRQMIQTRRRLLEQLIGAQSEYDSRLQELDSSSRELLDELNRGYRFALDRMYWRPSVAGPITTHDTIAAATWLFANSGWKESILRSIYGTAKNPGKLLFLAGILIALLAFRSRIVRRLQKAGELANVTDKPLKPLVEAVLLTLLLAGTLPIAFASLGSFLQTGEPAVVALRLGVALQWLALPALAIAFLWQVFRGGGLAQTQFGWSNERCQQMRRELLVLGLTLLPAVLVCFTFGREAAEHVGDPERVAFVGSLGRLAFVFGVVSFSVISVRVSRLLATTEADTFLRLPRTLLIAVGGAAGFLAVLSLLGWHLTAWVLCRLLIRSFFLIIDVAMLVALLDRLRYLRARNLRSKSAAELHEIPADQADEFQADRIPSAIEIESRDREVRGLLRFGAVATVVIGLFWIWSGQFSTLRYLERVQLLPTAGILPAAPASDSPDQSQPNPMSAAAQLPAKPTSEGGSQETSTASASDPRQSSDNGAWSLTLAGLVVAILIVLFTTVLAKNIPGVFDFVVLSRFNMASGDRKALTTLVSYALFLVGISLAAYKVGLQWSQIQWLAAAFSFGLGFGLQDFFANFFSGLVLLFERPMRVGDFCRFGNHLGTVESIGLRSTRVRALDRTIINVPNADFSKNELIVFAARDRILLETTLGLRYETTPEQLQFLLAKLRELLLSHPKIVQDPVRVRFSGFGDYSLNVQVYAYAETTRWEEFLAIKEDIFLRMMLIVKDSGTGFAFPSQTTYLATDAGNDQEKTASAEGQVKSWISIQNLPFPDFTQRQKRRFKNSLAFPPIGSPHSRSGLGSDPVSNIPARNSAIDEEVQSK